LPTLGRRAFQEPDAKAVPFRADWLGITEMKSSEHAQVPSELVAPHCRYEVQVNTTEGVIHGWLSQTQDLVDELTSMELCYFTNMPLDTARSFPSFEVHYLGLFSQN
jgi:hypothetical protein